MCNKRQMDQGLNKQYFFQSIDICFFINSILSFLPIPIVVFFLSNQSLTENDIAVLFSVKFWLVTFFSFFYPFLSTRFSVKNLLIISFFFKIFSYVFFIFFHGLVGCLIFISIISLSASIFSLSGKVYIQASAKNISEAFSKRFTVNNIAVALSPIIIILFDDFMSIIAFLIFISCFGTFITIYLLNDIKEEHIGHKHKLSSKLDIKLSMIVFLSCLLFSIYYLIYEKSIPIYFKGGNDKISYSIMTIINTCLIIFFQIKTYKIVTNVISEEKSLLASFFVCFLLSIPILILGKGFNTILLFVLGITYLEMFFSTGIDSIITKREKENSNKYFILFNVSLSISITLSGYLIENDKLIFSFSLIILIALFSLLINKK